MTGLPRLFAALSLLAACEQAPPPGIPAAALDRAPDTVGAAACPISSREFVENSVGSYADAIARLSGPYPREAQVLRDMSVNAASQTDLIYAETCIGVPGTRPLPSP